jgi:hypothetical protein
MITIDEKSITLETEVDDSTEDYQTLLIKSFEINENDLENFRVYN